MLRELRHRRAGRQAGFSLLEVLASLAILSIVMGVVLEGITTTQARNTLETNKIDLTQESRQFMDQIVNDLHQSGFPRMSLFAPATLASTTNCTQDLNVACGLISVSTTAIQFEGDVDGTGVSEGFIQLVQTNGPNAAACTSVPCVIQRGTISKTSCAPTSAGVCTGSSPSYYTEVNNVMNTNVFVAYDHNGNTIMPPAITTQAWQSNISAIGITLYVKSSQADPRTGLYPTITMVSTAKIND